MLDMSPDLLSYIAIVFILALLIGRIVHKQGLMKFQRFLPERLTRKSELPIMIFKNCPQCSDQLPVSALVCDACDYNFLARSILRHKLLPAPEASINSEPARQPLAL